MSVIQAPAVHSDEANRVPLPLLHDTVHQEVARERERLLREAGLAGTGPAHFKRPVERRFTRDQREHVTILTGGLTLRHEELIMAGLRGLGYKMARLPTPSKADFQA